MQTGTGVYYPIIYVRGYAMSQQEQDETTADPFCGFNLGATVYRAVADRSKPPKKFVFESPLLRLGSDYGYRDVYDNGLDILDDGWTGPGNSDPNLASLPAKCIVIHRYYDEASTLLGTGKTPPIEHFATRLNDLILRVRELVCKNPDNALTPATFRCYLVAHSMGGLVVRAFLQNLNLGSAEARRAVDKVFTYATPHNGIDTAGFNVPEFVSLDDINNFNRDRMAGYLNLQSLYQNTKRVDWVPEKIFPSRRIFCMIGTNRSDYETAAGLARTFVGHGSDGLVRIENASVYGVDDSGSPTEPAARAFCYRSHSGYFGIVNSEESYQNLTRFLFGTNRADVWLQVDSVQLPAALDGKEVDAAYQFEILASPLGKRWYLTRRIAEEDSVATRSHKDLTAPPPAGTDQNKGPKSDGPKNIYLSSVFLDKHARVNPNAPTLTFSVALRVRVPDYEVDRKFWFDQHIEGSYLYRDQFIVEVSPPELSGKADWAIKCRHVNDPADSSTVKVDVRRSDSQMILEIPVGDSSQKPGFSGKLQIYASSWNTWPRE